MGAYAMTAKIAKQKATAKKMTYLGKRASVPKASNRVMSGSKKRKSR